MAAVDTVKEHIQAGDVFQLVLSHRFRRRTFADPFEVYRQGLWRGFASFPSAAWVVCCLGGTLPGSG
jgi:anthranilate/para-aminobenzoate synthase component I